MISGAFRSLGEERDHEPPPKTLFAEPNKPLADVPSELTAMMITGTTNTSITAYSAVVGASSLVRNWRIREIIMDIWGSLIEATLSGTARFADRLATTPAQIRIDDEPNSPRDSLLAAPQKIKSRRRECC
jgi:hypothetical protein